MKIVAFASSAGINNLLQLQWEPRQGGGLVITELLAAPAVRGRGGSAAGSVGNVDKTLRTDDEVGRKVAAKRRVAVLRAALYNDTLVNFKRF